jgi:glycosyltransferase involved in cell wall biosynthesis
MTAPPPAPYRELSPPRGAVAPAIRVVAICRDEEHAIGGFLDQFAPLTRDWCLLDTGSTDRTVEIARERGARVVPAQFVDFAVARNEAIDRFGAGADWIVMLDIDERLDGETIATIPGLAASDAFDVWLAPLEAVAPDGSRRAFTPKPFLFRRDPALRWTFAVHEKLVGSMRQALVRNARIDHVISLHDPARRAHAASRYEAMMAREPYFTDAAYRERMRERWPILDHERLSDPRIGSVVAGPLVSVVVPTYRRRALLREAVRSALAQDWPTLELLVVGDHDPEIEAIAAEFRDEVRVRVIDLDRNHGSGGAVPRNTGIALARGEIIAYLDDDNTWAPDHLSSVVPVMRRADASFAFSSMTADGRDLRFVRPEFQGIDTSTIVHRRELAQRLGGWKERNDDYAHDWDLVSRWIAGGEPWACTRRATVRYGTAVNSQSTFMALLADRRAKADREREVRDARRRAADESSIDPHLPAQARWAARRELLACLAPLDEVANGVTFTPHAAPGVDDTPPFRWRGAWWRVDMTSSTARLVRLDEASGEVEAFALRGYGSPHDATCWMPVVEGERLRFVYSLGPSIVVDASAGDGTIVVERGSDPGVAIDHWRGGVPPISIEGGYLAIVHEGDRAARAHRFVELDTALLPVGASEPFAFRSPGDEVVVGFDRDPGGVRMRVQLAGASPGAASIALAEIRAMLLKWGLLKWGQTPNARKWGLNPNA